MVKSLLLDFPFVELSEVEAFFGGIPNYNEVLGSVPRAFYRDNEWSTVGMHFFNHPMTDDDMEKMGLLFITTSLEVMKAQFAYYWAWLGSFRPRHEDKKLCAGG